VPEASAEQKGNVVARALLTGAAGFIGSNLTDRLLASGWRVRGVDRFTAYYEEAQKRANLASATADGEFELIEADLLSAELGPLLDDVDVVFHQAAQPGVRLSWADGFRLYNDLNVNVTQRLLEACRRHEVKRFVYASSSSVYGQAPAWPTTEATETRPHSPYGVTKLAAEHLCRAYAANFGVPTVSLRYFTVYGPRQRPDMATHRLIQAARTGSGFPLYGDGQQIRDFTFVGDVVAANVLAATRDVSPGSVMNIAGGGSTKLLDLVELVGRCVGRDVPIDWQPAQPGDVERTGGSIELASEFLGWRPEVGIEEGVARQVAWHLEALPGG
jgi:UDP-glucuronate 4-epimerase